MRKTVFMKLALVLAGAFLFATVSHAQSFTTVTATVTDSNGIPYAGGSMSATLVPGTPGGWTLNGQPYNGQIGPVTLDSTGTFIANFGSNAVILPASTQWKITVGSNPGGIPPPLGTGAQTFSVTMTISGATQNISGTLNASAPKLTNFTSSGGSGTVTTIATTGPITGGPITTTGTIACPTCVTASGGGSINLAATQIGFGSGTNALIGSSNFTYSNPGGACGLTPEAALTLCGSAAGGTTFQTLPSSTEIISIADNTWSQVFSSSTGTGNTGSTRATFMGINMSGAAGGDAFNLDMYRNGVIQASIELGGSQVGRPSGVSGGLNFDGNGIAEFGVNNSDSTQTEWHVIPNGDMQLVTETGKNLCFEGTSTGEACVGVAATAGSPNPIHWPTTTATAGQVLSSNGANPQQLVWITPSGGGSVSNQVLRGISANSSGTPTVVDSVVCTPPATNGAFTVGYTVVASVAVSPTCPQVGVASTSIPGATSTYTVGTSVPNDASGIPIVHDIAGSSAVAVTLPTPTTLANTNAVVTYENRSAFTDTITPTTWTIQAGTSAASTTLTVNPGTRVQMIVDQFNATNWLATAVPIGGNTFFSNTSSSFPFAVRANGCDPSAAFQVPQGANFLTAAGTFCAKGPATNPGSAYNQTAGVFGSAYAFGGGTGESRSVGGSFYGFAQGNNTEAYGANFVAQDFDDGATGQQIIPAELDCQPQKLPSAYLGNGANVICLHLALYNQSGHGGTFGSAVSVDAHSFGTPAYFANGYDVNQGAICPTCPMLNINPQGTAVVGTNFSGYSMAFQYEDYWDGAQNQFESWRGPQPTIGSGTNPSNDVDLITHLNGPAGQTHFYGWGNNIYVGIQHTDATWDLLQASTATGSNVVNAFPGAAGTLALKLDNGGQVYNVKSSPFGATGNTQEWSNCSISGSSSTLTCPSATFTSAITGQIATVYMGAKYVWGGAYVSGGVITGSGAGTCAATLTGGATAILITNGNGVTAHTDLIMLTGGTGYSVAPTAATISTPGGGATGCSGSITITSVLLPAVVNTSVTYASATTLTLGTAATTAVTTSFASIGTDDTTAIQAAISACTAGTGGTVFFPAGYYRVASGGTALTMATGCSLVGISPQTTNSATGNPDTAYSPSGGTWLDGSGNTNILTGNTLRGANLLHLGFTDWSGLSGTAQALVFGGNNLDGISFSEISDLQFIGLPTTDTSDQGLIIYNFEHVTSTGIRMNNVSTCMTLNNQSQYIQGGNSEFYGFYCSTYAESAANANNSENPLGIIGSLTPSAGSPLPIDYITFVRPQINSNGGDSLNTIVLEKNALAIRIIGFDLEGTYQNGVTIQSTSNSTTEFDVINQVGSGSPTTVNISGGNYNNTISAANTFTYNNSLGTNTFNGVLSTSSSSSVADALGTYTGASGGVRSNVNQVVISSTVTPSGNLTPGAVGTVNLGTGSTSGTGGAMAGVAFESAGTKFTASGCSNGTTVGGASAGKFTLGANTCTVVITMNGATGFTANNGWSCHANDETTSAANATLYFPSNNATTASLSVPVTAGTTDVIDFGCTPF